MSSYCFCQMLSVIYVFFFFFKQMSSRLLGCEFNKMQCDGTATNGLQGSLLIGLSVKKKFLIKRHSVFPDCVGENTLSNITEKKKQT